MDKQYQADLITGKSTRWVPETIADFTELEQYNFEAEYLNHFSSK